MRIKAVIFDWAGTVVDFGCQAPVAVLKEIFLRRGIALTDAEARAGMGLPKKEHIRQICAAGGYDLDVEALYADFEPAQLDTIADHSHVIEGVPETAEALRHLGVKIGSSTGYTRAMLDRVLPVAAREGFVPDSSVTPDETCGGRPYPWMCYVNAMRLGVYPLEAMVKVGDTPVDMEEGRNAGMLSIGVIDSSNEVGVRAEAFAALSDRERDALRVAARRRLLDAGAHHTIDALGQLIPLLRTLGRLD
jgi:phosphonoacetaldehyde hydrolase